MKKTREVIVRQSAGQNQLAPSCRREVIERKSRQNLVFDPGGCSGRLCDCLRLGGRCKLLCKGVGLGRHDGTQAGSSLERG